MASSILWICVILGIYKRSEYVAWMAKNVQYNKKYPRRFNILGDTPNFFSRITCGIFIFQGVSKALQSSPFPHVVLQYTVLVGPNCSTNTLCFFYVSPFQLLTDCLCEEVSEECGKKAGILLSNFIQRLLAPISSQCELTLPRKSKQDIVFLLSLSSLTPLAL